MREIDSYTQQVDPELLAIPEISEALSLAEESAYSLSELQAYESFRSTHPKDLDGCKI